MEILKIDQLSVAARAGALDGTLAYASIYTQHQDLITQSALSGLRGLEQTLSETGIYGQAVQSLKEASQKIEEANIEALKDPFGPASAGLQSQHTSDVVNGMRTQGWPFRTTAQNIQSTAQNAVNGTGATNPERGHANSVKQAADELELAAAYLVNQADPNAARFHATNALNNATTARSNASTLLGQLLAANPFSASRYNATNEVVREAQKVIDHANSVLHFVNNAPIVLIRSQTPTTHDLGGGYSLSTWGNSGYWTMTDASGEGILVHPNGNVDNLKGGAGWKFNHTSTFVLPNQTKITVNPGSPADLLISRGVHAFTINNVNGNAWPGVGSYSALNGRDVDRATNDGHILQMNGNAARWQNNGNFLGDAGGREIIATVAITNELRLDPTDVAISADFQAFLTEVGISDYDYDGDGKLNNIELMNVAIQTESYIRQIQDAYEQALARIAAANQALNELNEIIELLRKQADKSAEERGVENTAAKAELQAIERRLVSALQLLQGDALFQAPPGGDIESSAIKVLDKLTTLTQSGGIVPITPTAQPNNTGGTTTPPINGTQQTTNTPNNDPLGDSLRRAGRLLSGILGGGNLNILEIPPKTQAPTVGSPTTSDNAVSDTSLQGTGTNAGESQVGSPSTGTSQTPPGQPSEPTNATSGTETANQDSVQDVTTPIIVGSPELTDLSTAPTTTSENALAGLLAQLSVTDNSGSPGVNPQNLSVGLEALLTTLVQLGVFSTSDEAALTDLLQTLGSSLPTPTDPSSPTDSVNLTGTSPTSPPQAPQTSLFDFLSALDRLGGALQQADVSTQSPTTQQSPAPPTVNDASSLPVPVQQLLELLTGPSTASLPPLTAVLQQVADILAGRTQPSITDTGTGQQGTVSGTLRDLSRTSEQVMDLLSGQAELGSAGAQQSSGSSSFTTQSSPPLSRTAEQLMLVLQGLAALGSAGAGQSTSTSGSQAPTATEMRLGLQSLLSILGAYGLLGDNKPTSSTSTGGSTGVFGQSGGSQALGTITGNFQTDPELMKIIQENLSKALQTQQRQLSQASTLFTQSQEIVLKFVSLIETDDLVREVVKSDDLSDEQQALFDDRMKDLRKDWGMEWGSTEDNTPASQSNLVSRAVQSGMMV